jgi:aldehyde dehydrogenase (NAD+)
MREPTRLVNAKAIAQRAHAVFASEKTRPYAFRKQALESLCAAIQKHEQGIFDAMKADLNRPLHEAYPAEVGLVYVDIKHALKHLKSWMKPARVSTPLSFQPAASYIQAEPLGAALIIAPWNYPAQLALAPVVGAIAAGCTVVLKPSELSVHTSALMETLLRDAFGDDGVVQVVHGDASASTALLAEKWDHIFFTGSTRIGQVVMEAAAKHLTPVTLELGGKSPTLVDADANLEVAARRIIWAKVMNAGQTCIAPDYVLVHESVKAPLIDAMKAALKQFYGDNVKASPDFSRIISQRHTKRLGELMRGGTVVVGGEADEAERYIAPTVLDNVKLDHPLMQEEIFGPLLPLVPVKSMNEAIDFVNARPKPLALYIFTTTPATADTVLKRTSSGGAVVNDCLFHVASTELPFGGVGASGMGKYHGKASFDCFSNPKAIVKKPNWLDLKVRYPPYSVPLSVLRKILG